MSVHTFVLFRNGLVILASVLLGMFIGISVDRSSNKSTSSPLYRGTIPFSTNTNCETEAFPQTNENQLEPKLHQGQEKQAESIFEPRTQGDELSKLIEPMFWRQVSSFKIDEEFQNLFQAVPWVDSTSHGVFFNWKQTDPDKLDSFSDISSNCREIDIVRVGKPACLAVFQSKQFQSPYHVFRYTPSTNQTGDVESRKLQYTSRVKGWDVKLPFKKYFDIQEQFVMDLFLHIEHIEKDIEKLIAVMPGVKKSKDVTVMCVNLGNLDLLINFVNSARYYGINIDNLLVFAADQQTYAILKANGIGCYWHEGLGDLPSKGSNGYGDMTFTKIMWLKVVSVYLVNRVGYNVLFQDADLVWFRDPFPLFHSEFPEVDTIWMDDGARTERFTPYYSNTGFYYIRYSKRTRNFMQSIIFSYHLILAHNSHQSVVTQILIEHSSLFALSVKLFDEKMFPSGRVYHHEKALLNSMIQGEFRPFVFHMCWTESRKDKLVNFKNANMWYINDDKCDSSLFGQKTPEDTFWKNCFDPARGIDFK